MIKLGEFQEMELLEINEHGGYLGLPGSTPILLPGLQLPAGAKAGDRIRVFIYKDSKDRPIATVHEPALTLGGIARLQVVSTSRIGAFLDWGLEKDLFLPFKEQTEKLHKGDYVVVSLYIDKSERLCASMRIYDKLSSDSPYERGSKVHGYIYQFSETLGALVAVDLKYHGLIQKKELFGRHKIGEEVEARVTGVRRDGRLNLTIRSKAYRQMGDDAEEVYLKIQDLGGRLPFTDKASPMVIDREFGLSKAAFKRAVGKLLKEERIRITEDGIEILQ